MAVILGAFSQLVKQAATPVAGFALVNGTPNILTWTPPNDGQLHRAIIISSLDITSGETGGLIQAVNTAPDGTTAGFQMYAANLGAGLQAGFTGYLFICKGGSPLAINQASALTGGVSTLWAEIWGS